jgi:hypothetical protein
MSPIIDFADIPILEPVPDGTYQVEVAYAKEGKSKQQFDKIDIRWKVTSGEYTDRLIFDHLSFAPNALWRTKLALEALGYDAGFSGEVVDEELIGLPAEVDVTFEAGRGTNPETGETYPDRNVVTKVRPASSTIGSLLSGKAKTKR